MLLFLPGIVMLFLLVRRAIDPLAGAMAALLFATTPMVGYFGPMVVHDGAVLTCGLGTAAAFWHHVARPARQSFWATAALFFVTTQLDFLGHFWGVGLFALGFATPRPRQAMRTAAALVLVSLGSLLLVAIHYSLFLGDPLALLHGMASLRAESDQRTPSLPELAGAAREVLVIYGAWPIYGLAALGLAMAVTHRRGRRTVLIAFALVIPGSLACLASLRHLVDHCFWSTPVMAGIAVLAAIPLATAYGWLGELGAMRRAAGAVVLMLGMSAIGYGVGTTKDLVERFRPADTGFPSMAAEASPLAQGCAIALTNRPVPMRSYLPGLLFVGGIGGVLEFERCRQFGAARGVRCDVAFLLDPLHADPALVARLDAMATAQRLPHVTFYRLHLEPTPR